MKDFWEDKVHLRQVALVASNVQEDQELYDFLGMLLLVEDYLLNCVKNHILVFCDALWNEVYDSLKALIKAFDVLWTTVHSIPTNRV